MLGVPNDDAEQVEDEFRSLMEGLRTTLPGVQLVTAFLLTVPLYDKYDTLVRSERVAYYIAFASALVSSVLLMAPSSHQRLRSRGGNVAREHRQHVQTAVRLTVLGSGGFAIALTAVAFLVSSVVLATGVAIAVTAVVAAVCLWSWYYLPLVVFEREG
jgi:cobalamin synthase